ncbi:MAG: hypothetical protein P8J33_09490 [Pirellulaceae bacterium]|nr:hypothetical protein [Pirellulaceae bacterium]
MKKIPTRLIAGLSGGAVLVFGLFAAVFYSANSAPDFYQQALQVSSAQNEIEGCLFERHLAGLSNQIQADGPWSVVWTSAQINGWLASDLMEKFPDALPDSIIEPRVAITENDIRIAFRYDSLVFDGIIEIRGDVFATEIENQIALRINTVHSGFFPVPISWWAERLEVSLRNRDIIVEWTELERDPVALITLPRSFGNSRGSRIILDGVQLTEQLIGIAGRTVQETFQSVSEGSDSAESTQRLGGTSPDSRLK